MSSGLRLFMPRRVRFGVLGVCPNERIFTVGGKYDWTGTSGSKVKAKTRERSINGRIAVIGFGLPCETITQSPTCKSFAIFSEATPCSSGTVTRWPGVTLKHWSSTRTPVTESGFLRLWNKSKIGIPEEFLKLVSKHGSAQYRRIIIGRSQQNWFAIRRLMESKNKP